MLLFTGTVSSLGLRSSSPASTMSLRSCFRSGCLRIACSASSGLAGFFSAGMAARLPGLGVDGEAARPAGTRDDPLDALQQLVGTHGKRGGELDQRVHARQAIACLHEADVGAVQRGAPPV